MEFNLKKVQHKTVSGRMDTKKIIQIEILDLEDDNKVVFTTTSQKGTTKKTAISVEQYNEYRDLQLAIMASLSHPQNFINLEYDNDDDDMHVLNFVPKNTTPLGKRKKPFSIHSTTENGQSSNSKHNDPSFVCEICVEPKLPNESFSIKGCSHMYCTDCMIKYVASKLQGSITSIRCPVADCRGVLEAQYCRNILPQEVFDRWSNALCEAAILGAQKFYCPFKDCSALLINEDDEGKAAIRESECPYCNRLFCAQCKVAWHAGIECEEFQKLNKNEREPEDIMLMNLAKNKKWRRCQMCKYFIEKRGGCGYVRCRCGFAFHDYI